MSEMPDLFHTVEEESSESNLSSVRRSRTAKSATAYRTISEVAEELGLAAHVLRFWETKFKPLQPLKRSGGRRFYRPEDVALLRQIKTLLYDEGYTIKGVQAYLKKGRTIQAVETKEDVVASRKLVSELKEIQSLLAV